MQYFQYKPITCQRHKEKHGKMIKKKSDIRFTTNKTQLQRVTLKYIGDNLVITFQLFRRPVLNDIQPIA